MHGSCANSNMIGMSVEQLKEPLQAAGTPHHGTFCPLLPAFLPLLLLLT
jgi:hypothetical protein